MRFTATPLPGAFELELERHDDDRGYFARSWCAEEFAAHGLPTIMVQGSVSWNARRGTLRGLHFQWPPSQEGKLVRCEQGAVHDVVLDLRPRSPTFLRHHAVTLDAACGNALYIPPGLAHGFQTLVNDTRVGYLMTDFHASGLAAGVRYNDRSFGINWPLPVAMLSDRDRDCPDFDRDAHLLRYGAGQA